MLRGVAGIRRRAGVRCCGAVSDDGIGCNIRIPGNGCGGRTDVRLQVRNYYLMLAPKRWEAKQQTDHCFFQGRFPLFRGTPAPALDDCRTTPRTTPLWAKIPNSLCGVGGQAVVLYDRDGSILAFRSPKST